MIEWASSWVFWALPLPLLVWLILPNRQTVASAALKVPFLGGLQSADNASSGKSTSRYGRFPWVKLAVWVLLVTSAAQPQWVDEPITLPTTARDIMLAVDVSGSMETPDMSINGRDVDRLVMVKSVMEPFIESRQGDRLGLVLFGSQAYLQAPLTLDVNTVAQLLDESAIGIAGKKTAIGDAIGLALKRLDQLDNERKVLVLITDGANTAGEIAPLKAAELAGKSGLTIYTIGVGADSMVVEGFFRDRVVNPSKDLDETTLKEIANLAGGQYFRAHNTKEMQEITHKLDKLEPVDTDAETYRPRQDLYNRPLAAAIILLLLESFFKVISQLLSTRYKPEVAQ